MDYRDPFAFDLDEETLQQLAEIEARLTLPPRPPARRRPQREQPLPTIRQLQAADKSWFIPPPFGWQYPMYGRDGSLPDPALLAFGQYLKRARYLALLSQHELAKATGVDQGLISRIERAKAPWVRLDRLVKLGDGLGRAFPFGYCPHEHWCVWQAAPQPPPEKDPDYVRPFLLEASQRMDGKLPDE